MVGHTNIHQQIEKWLSPCYIQCKGLTGYDLGCKTGQQNKHHTSSKRKTSNLTTIATQKTNGLWIWPHLEQIGYSNTRYDLKPKICNMYDLAPYFIQEKNLKLHYNHTEDKWPLNMALSRSKEGIQILCTIHLKPKKHCNKLWLWQLVILKLLKLLACCLCVCILHSSKITNSFTFPVCKRLKKSRCQ